MSENTGNRAKHPHRRSFLSYATYGMGGLVVGAGMIGLGRSFVPSADIEAAQKWVARLDLLTLKVGETLAIRSKNRPVHVRRLTAEQIDIAKSQAVNDLPDSLANNPNISGKVHATYSNRSVIADRTIVVFDARCTRLGCVLLPDAGDYDGWFCPCDGTHYDVLGRIRKGPAPSNMWIPRYQVSDAGFLTIFEGPAPISETELDRLIYR